MLALALLTAPRCALAFPGPALAAPHPAPAAPWEAHAGPATDGGDSLAAPDRSAPLPPLAAFSLPRARAWQVGLLRPDRMAHMELSFALTSALIILTRDRRAAASAALTLGVGKELWDQRGSSGFDGTDLAADAAGVGLTVVLLRGRGH